MPRARPRHLQIIAILLITNLLFFGMTNPMSVKAPYLIIGFALLSFTLYFAINGLFKLLRLYGLPIGAKSRRTSLGVTGLVAGLAALQSVGQLTSRDLMVLLPLALLVYLYVSYNRSALGE